MDAEAWKVLLDDMDRLAQGLLPDGNHIYVDDNGRVWGGILLFGTGDLEQLCFCWGCVSYNAMDEMCPWCLANRSTMPFTNCQEDAEWRPTECLSNDVQVRG